MAAGCGFDPGSQGRQMMMMKTKALAGTSGSNPCPIDFLHFDIDIAYFFMGDFS